MQPTEATLAPWRFLSDGFWDRYVASLRAKQVKPTAVRWHVIRAEHSRPTMSPQRLAAHTARPLPAC